MWNSVASTIVSLLYLITLVTADEVNCTHGDIRLYNGTGPHEGSVQICTSDNNTWSAVCDYSWDCVDATVACNQLGYSGTDALVLTDSFFGEWSTIEFGYFQCSSDSNKLIDCNQYNSYTCTAQDLAGVRCVTYTSECSHGDVRLTGGESSDEGIVEMCYNGIWTPVCSSHTGDEEATVVCKQLGYTQYTWASIFTEGYGNTPLVKQYLRPTCTTSFSESQLIDCSIQLMEDQCSVYCEAGRIKCFEPGECDEGDARLVNGDIEQEGRLEVCTNGVWGTVCSNGFSTTDGYVACKQLQRGDSATGPVVYSGKFSDGVYPVVMSYVSCGGWERELTDCTHSTYGSFTCSRTTVVGLLCHDDCVDGDVRLMSDGDTSNEGTVEVCVGSLWGMIAQSRWSLEDGQVVCGQLGLPVEGTQVYNNSRYGKSKRPININNVACTGSESKLLDCNHFVFSDDDKRSLQSLVEVVGVKCGGGGGGGGSDATAEPTIANGDTSVTATCDCDDATMLTAGVYLTLAVVIAAFITIIALLLYIVCQRRTKQQSYTNLKLHNPPPLPPPNNVYDKADDGMYSEMT